MLKALFKNPFRYWIEWLILKYKLEKTYRSKNLQIRYMAEVGNVLFGKYNVIDQYVRINNCSLGDYSYISERSILKNCTLGKFCSIGPDCRIGLGKHPSSIFVSSHPIFFSPLKQVGISFANKNYFTEFEPIKIGHDVWVGANSLILDGVSIGDGAIIAAGSVVSKDVEPFSIVGGVPSKKIKMRFKEEQIKIIEKLRWWDWDTDRLQQEFKVFHNINNFTNLVE